MDFYDKITRVHSPIPWSREEALNLSLPRYLDRDGCADCIKSGRHSGSRSRYSESAKCVDCLSIEIDALWPQWECGDPGRPEPWSSPDWHYGDTAYPRLCLNGYHLRKTSNATGKCLNCEAVAASARLAAKSPRARARSLGYNTYIPDDACPACGDIAPRYVVSNLCRGCKGEDKRQSATRAFACDNPTMLLDKASAKAMGFTLYRSGNACRKGHKSWRYVSTGNCLDCLNS